MYDYINIVRHGGGIEQQSHIAKNVYILKVINFLKWKLHNI